VTPGSIGGMRRLVASVTALVTVGATGCFGAGSAAADDPPAPPPKPAADGTPPPIGTPGRGYALGGAHVLGIPYDQYIMDTGKHWFAENQPQKQIVRYPAGQVQGHTLERLFPGIGAIGEQILPGLGLDGPSIGQSVDEGAPHTIQTIKAGGPGTVMGLSEGAMVLNEVQAQLANDPNAPPRDQLSFAMFGDPVGKHAFGESFLTQMFPVGAVVPSLDYRIPAPVESQYDTERARPEHPHDGQLQGREDDDVHDPRAASADRDGIQVPRGGRAHAESARRGAAAHGGRGLLP
jgi:diacyltrehalose acyltransferase